MMKKLARTLFHAASLVNTLSYVAGGNPEKLVKHLVRKRATKLGASLVRKIK